MVFVKMVQLAALISAGCGAVTSTVPLAGSQSFGIDPETGRTTTETMMLEYADKNDYDILPSPGKPTLKSSRKNGAIRVVNDNSKATSRIVPPRPDKAGAAREDEPSNKPVSRDG